jgi:hypothetical protein
MPVQRIMVFAFVVALAPLSVLPLACSSERADTSQSGLAADSGKPPLAADSGTVPDAGGKESPAGRGATQAEAGAPDAGSMAAGASSQPTMTLEDDAGAADSGSEPDRSSCLDGITNYKERGPFSFDKKRSGMVQIWAPRVPAGCRVPVVHFSNGTGAQCDSYVGILEHIASHGFLTTCYESTDTGDGTQCMSAIETALSEYPSLVDTKIGSTGHEVGGGGAILCVQRAEQKWGSAMIYAGHAAAPVSGSGAVDNYRELFGMIESPIFMFNGSEDMLVPVSWVREGYDALHSEKWWYEAEGATHIPVPTRWAQESAVVWFRWKLLGDENAGDYFKNMPNGMDWNLQEMHARM